MIFKNFESDSRTVVHLSNVAHGALVNFYFLAEKKDFNKIDFISRLIHT